MKDAIRQILVIQTAYLGDVILITPLIREAKRVFPDAAIDALVIPQTRQALENNPHIRHIHIFDKRRHKIWALLKTAVNIRKHQYDLAIAPHSSFTTMMIMLLGGIRTRLGFDRWFASRFLTFKVPHPRSMHKIEKNLSLLHVFSEEPFDKQTELFPLQESRKKYQALADSLPYENRPIIALAPGSIWFTKRWPANYYEQLSRMLDEDRYNLIFFGSPEESALCDKIIDRTGIPALNVAGKTDILESAAILEMCDLLICNDSGAMHMANAMRTDVFAIFGPTVRDIGYFPYRPNDKVFEVELECRPCSKHGSDRCPLGHHRCMFEVTPSWIRAEVNRRFETA